MAIIKSDRIKTKTSETGPSQKRLYDGPGYPMISLIKKGGSREGRKRAKIWGQKRATYVYEKENPGHRHIIGGGGASWIEGRKDGSILLRRK